VGVPSAVRLLFLPEVRVENLFMPARTSRYAAGAYFYRVTQLEISLFASWADAYSCAPATHSAFSARTAEAGRVSFRCAARAAAERRHRHSMLAALASGGVISNTVSSERRRVAMATQEASAAYRRHINMATRWHIDATCAYGAYLIFAQNNITLGRRDSTCGDRS